ncbi:MAG: hypothetical protein ACXWLF_08960 [Myxococcaceae bacterium]
MVTTIGEPTASAGEVTSWFWFKNGDALLLTVGQNRRLGSKDLDQVLPDALAPVKSGGEMQVDDVPCPGSAIGEPVVSDPRVLRALRLLSAAR